MKSALAAVGIVVAVTLVGVAPAGADPVVVYGSVVSVVEPDTRRVTVAATYDGGVVRFRHWAPAGLSSFVATVSCLAEQGGVVFLTGEVVRGKTAAGVVLDGRDFGMTLVPGAEPQRFSLPRFGPPGTLAPCSGAARPGAGHRGRAEPGLDLLGDRVRKDRPRACPAAHGGRARG